MISKILFLAFLLSPLLAKPQNDDENIMNSGEIISHNKLFELGYSDTRKAIFTTGTLSNNKYKFMMDSGAPTFISRQIQDTYNYPSLTEGTVIDASGKKSGIEIVRIDTITFGEFTFTNIPALVFDISATPLSCDSLAGNLGSNIMRHLIIRFDIQNEKITFSTGRKLLPEAGTKYHPARINHQSDIFFPVTINSNFSDTIHFDSGDGYLYHISKDAAGKLSILYRENIIRKGFGVASIGTLGVGEGFDQTIFKANSFSLSGEEVNDALIYITGNNISRMGRDLLNYGVLELDYLQSRYSFKKYLSPVVQPRYDYGFIPVPDGQKITVGIVWEDSEAIKQGLKVGDEIKEINGIEFATLPFCEVEKVVKDLLTSPELRLKVSRAGETRSYQISRKEL